LQAGIKKAEQKQGVNYYLADLKPSEYNDNTQSQAGASSQPPLPVNSQGEQQGDSSDLPF